MSTQSIRSPYAFNTAVVQPLPQGTVWRRTALALWQWLEAAGQARARSELLRLARVHEGTNATLTRQLRETAEQLA